jgi:hypothetical protein
VPPHPLAPLPVPLLRMPELPKPPRDEAADATRPKAGLARVICVAPGVGVGDPPEAVSPML